MSDERAKLREADELVRRGETSEALRVYAVVARSFQRQRLKAIAVWKQVRDVIRLEAADEVDLDAEARAALVQLFRELGLEEDARAIETERASLLH